MARDFPLPHGSSTPAILQPQQQQPQWGFGESSGTWQPTNNGQQRLSVGTNYAYRNSLSLSPPASASPSSVHRTSPMTWAQSLMPQYQQLPQPQPTLATSFAPSSVEPHTPPPSVGVVGVRPTSNGSTMEQYLKSTWNTGSADYVPLYNDVLPAPSMDDQLLVKAGPNAPPRPLHMFMAPLTLDSMPVSPPPSNKRIDMRLAQPGTEESKPGYLTPLAQYTGALFPSCPLARPC